MANDNNSKTKHVSKNLTMGITIILRFLSTSQKENMLSYSFKIQFA